MTDIRAKDFTELCDLLSQRYGESIERVVSPSVIIKDGWISVAYGDPPVIASAFTYRTDNGKLQTVLMPFGLWVQSQEKAA